MKLNTETYVLFDEIERKKSTLLRDTNYCLKVDNIHNRFNEAASVQSEWVEVPMLFASYLEGSSSAKEMECKIRSMSRELREKSVKGWKYLLRNQPTSKNLGHDLLINVGKIIHPQNNSYRDYRVTMGLDNYTPPNPLRIFDYLEETFVNFKEIISPVEAALYLHLRISGIQPFGDGNKRTARLLQNFVLYENKLPPAVITLGERKHYIQMLETGLVGYRDNDPRLVSTFYNYVAGKVNTTLDQMLGLK